MDRSPRAQIMVIPSEAEGSRGSYLEDLASGSFGFARDDYFMNHQRLFIAIDLPDKITESLNALDPHYRGLLFSAPSQIHLTLAFFATVDPVTANLLKEN